MAQKESIAAQQTATREAAAQADKASEVAYCFLQGHDACPRPPARTLARPAPARPILDSQIVLFTS